MDKRNLSALAALIAFALSSALPARAAQPSAADIVDALTCNASMTGQQMASLFESSWFRKAASAEEGFELVKPAHSQGICIKSAKVVGAFGVLMVVGQTCDGDFRALKTSFEKQFPDKPSAQLEPGQLFTGKAKAGEGMIYKGSATMPPKPRANASEVAFLCARQMGGTQ